MKEAAFHSEENELFKCFSCFDDSFIDSLQKYRYLYLLLSGMDIAQREIKGLLLWQETVVPVSQTLFRDIYSKHFSSAQTV